MADDPASPKPTLQLLGGGDGWRTARAAALGAAGWRLVDAGTGPGEAPDAVLQQLDAADGIGGLLAAPGLPALVLDSAVVVCAAQLSEADETALIGAGVEAVLVGADLGDGDVLRALRQAMGRKRLERAGRMAYATDLATGLPHQAQLLEHMAQLLALREREPAPMVLLVLRVDGFRQVAERLGAEAGNVLRRKVAVRLRSGLRASDVVAALGDDTYAVLLGRLEAKGDGERVAAKLVKAVQAPLSVAGQPCRVEAAVGLAVYPDHGKDAKSLLARAAAQAGSVGTADAGFAVPVRRIGSAAANEPG